MGHDLYQKAKQAQQRSDLKIDLTNNTKKIVQTLLKFEERMSGSSPNGLNYVNTVELEQSTQEHVAELEDHLTKEIIAALSSEVDLATVRSIIQTIDPLLAPLPPKPPSDKSNPPPYIKSAAVVGEQIPVGKNQKPKPKPKPAKKNTKDKPIKFEGMTVILTQICQVKSQKPLTTSCSGTNRRWSGKSTSSRWRMAR